MLKNNRIIRLFISMILVFTFVFTSCNMLFVSAAEEQKTWKTAKELISEDGFLNGIQMISTDSKSTGNDIGDGGIWKTRENFKPEIWHEFFANSKAMGFEICKIWNNYQMGGIVFDDDWKVVGPSDTYLENLETIFQIAQEYDLYICLTLMTHFESSFESQNNQYNYDRLVRLIHNEEYRNAFINNWVIPVLELSAQYPNVIMADLYCEPEADGGLWSVNRGTNWDNMRTFISELNKTVEEYDSKLATYSSSSALTNEITKLYNGLGLDYYGYDSYSEADDLADPKELFLDRPFVFGEIGAKKGMENTDSNLSSFYTSYLNQCINKGVKAAFFWSYHPANYNIHSLVDNSGTGKLRIATEYFRQWVNENDTAADKPAIMYSTQDYIRFFGVSGVSSYTVQRSENKTSWSDVVTVTSSNLFENSTMMYECVDTTAQVGKTYYYRIKAGSTYSEDYPITIYRDVDDENNLIVNGNFVSGSENWFTDDADAPANYYQEITDGSQKRPGATDNYSLHNPMYMYQDVELKANTDYTFTFFYKYENALGYYSQYFGLLDAFPDGNNVKFDSKDWFKQGSIMVNPIQPDINRNRNGEWHKYTCRFNSGDVTKVRVIFDTYYGTSSDRANWYLDDVYLFEN